MIPRSEIVAGYCPGIGFDPELFARNKDGFIVSADTFIKEDIIRGKNLIGTDGFAVEFRTQPINYLEGAYEIVKDNILHVFELTESFGLKTVASPVEDVTYDNIMAAGPNSRIFGCQSDVCIYTGDQASVKLDATKHLERYAGCHIHFGKWKNANRLNTEESFHIGAPQLIRMMDIMFMPFIQHESDGDITRRRYYGGVGSFRFQPHGLEYRTPSATIISSPQLFDKYTEVMTRAVKMYDEGLENTVLNIGSEFGEHFIIDTINGSNKVAAQSIVDELLGAGVLFDTDIIPIHEMDIYNWCSQ